MRLMDNCLSKTTTRTRTTCLPPPTVTIHHHRPTAIQKKKNYWPFYTKPPKPLKKPLKIPTSATNKSTNSSKPTNKSRQITIKLNYSRMLNKCKTKRNNKISSRNNNWRINSIKCSKNPIRNWRKNWNSNDCCY